MFQPKIGLCIALTCCAGAAYAQEGEPTVLEMRVKASYPRRAIVDRGSADGLAVGDRVVFRSRDGVERWGRVARVEDRGAIVVPDDADFVPPPGMRAEARIPASRFAVIEDPTLPREPVPSGTPPEHPPWERTDDEWTADMPLLAQVRPFRPEERDAFLTGRLWATGDITDNSEDDRSSSFFRAGASLEYVNLFGGGGTFHFDGEWDHRDVNVSDNDGANDGENDTRFLLDRLSYSWGGHRFAPDRFEVGRLLHSEMPEFGLVDGIEWNHHVTGGGAYGASAGFQPEWDTLSDEGREQELALWYRWSRDESEILSLGAGYQKTFTDLNSDRDLFVLKAHWLPPDAWTLQATAWIDLYTGEDVAKGAGAEVTQAWVSAGRVWAGGHSLRFSYRHQAFPEMDTEEYRPVTDAQLADDHLDRVAMSARQDMGKVALLEDVGAWIDEDDEGGDGELGLEFDDLIFDGILIDGGVFATQGRYTTLGGWRAGFGHSGHHVGWHLGYEFVLNKQQGFTANNDELPQHKVGLDFDWNTASGWSFALHADLFLYDEEDGWTAGLYAQRSF